MLDNIKGIIFDLDGTLIDSMWIWKGIDIEFLEKRGYELPDDLQKAIEGMSFTETASYFKNRFQLKETIDEIKNEWNIMTAEYYRNNIMMKKGALDFIQFLKNNNYKLGIGTSNSIELTLEVLKKHDIMQYFDSIRTSCEVEKGKPSPDIFLKVAEDLNLKPEECFVFEDTYAGVLAAKRAGMKVCAVADEFSFPYKDEISSLADKYIEDYIDIA